MARFFFGVVLLATLLRWEVEQEKLSMVWALGVVRRLGS